jgi:hypothetical protein
VTTLVSEYGLPSILSNTPEAVPVSKVLALKIAV